MRVKESSLAGTWYPASREALRETVAELLARAGQPAVSDPLGLVVPHAGYRYSGQAAAFAYRLLQSSRCNRVVILAPSHFVALGGAALPPVDLFRTPLGDVRVDRAAVGELAGQPGFSVDLGPFRDEHSYEIQLPFLQMVLEELAVVPVVLGRMRQEEMARMGRVLSRLGDDRTVFVASSDFVHYGDRFGFVPFPAQTADQVKGALAELDGGAISAILSGSAASFLDYVASTGATICGRVPIGVLMAALGPGHRAHKLCYYTSLDITGDWSSTVSYAAIAFERAVEN